MKFIIGFLSGVVVGGYIANEMTQAQRSRVRQRASNAVERASTVAKESSIGAAVSDNLHKVGGAAGERVAAVIDDAGDKLEAVTAPSDDAATSAGIST
jgi:hypothetical protein